MTPNSGSAALRHLFPAPIRSLLAVFCLLPSLAMAFTPSGLLEIHQINVQQGEATLVIGPDGTRVLLDAGKNGKGSQIISYLQGLGIQPADGLHWTIGGHMDSDHVGGMDEVIAGGYDVLLGNWYNGSSKSTTTVEDYKTAAAGTTGGAVATAILGDSIPLGDGATLTIVAVGGAVIGSGAVSGATNENDLSVAVLVEYGDFDYIWASDLGGGDDDNACTGRSTSQANVETPLAQAITPGGAWPLLSAEGVDVVHVNHHGSESSTNSDWMNLLQPEVAVIPVGAGQGGTWHHPRQDILDEVLLANANCVTAPPVALVLQTEEGSPTGSQTSFNGFAVGDIVVTTDGVTDYTLSASGNVSQGPDERSAAGLPLTLALDEGTGGGGNAAPAVAISAPAGGTTVTEGDTLAFAGSADDAEDGNIAASLAWASDLDGSIGSGAGFSTSSLSVGSHIVTASVTDSGGKNGSAVVQVTVNAAGGGGGGGGLILSEVLYDVSSGDDKYEWVELYNAGSTTIDLSGWSLGAGGSSYTYTTVQLTGTVAPGATFVVGGTRSQSKNANPSYDQSNNINPDLQNSGSTADAVALFDVPASAITGSTVPVDAVVYGNNNSNNLIDESGVANPPEVGDAPAGSSIERTSIGGAWQVQGNPTPNSTPL